MSTDDNGTVATRTESIAVCYDCLHQIGYGYSDLPRDRRMVHNYRTDYLLELHRYVSVGRYEYGYSLTPCHLCDGGPGFRFEVEVAP